MDDAYARLRPERLRLRTDASGRWNKMLRYNDAIALQHARISALEACVALVGDRSVTTCYESVISTTPPDELAATNMSQARSKHN